MNQNEKDEVKSKNSNKVAKVANIIVDIAIGVMGVYLVGMLSGFWFLNYTKGVSMKPNMNNGELSLSTNYKVGKSNIHRGEVVVVDRGEELWVKRVIGVPGDEINIVDGDVYLNQKLIDETKYAVGTSEIVYMGDGNISFPYRLNEKEYFVMGDNRVESYDSRYVGAIKEENIKGKVRFVFSFKPRVLKSEIELD